MNYELSAEVIKILDNLGERFGIAVDWTSKNTMPYLQELFDKFINWEIWTSVMFGGIGVVLLIVSITLFVLGNKACKLGYDESFCIIFGVCALIIGSTMVFSQLYDIIECMTFPEKALFDYMTYSTECD